MNTFHSFIIIITIIALYPIVLVAFLVFCIHKRLDFLNVGFSLCKAAIYKQDNTDIESKHTNIHGSSAIRTHDQSV
jgi:hypothetical protein